MNLRKSKLVLLLGASLFAACSSMPKISENPNLPRNLENYARYEREIITDGEKTITEGFDTDKDGKDDLRFCYSENCVINNKIYTSLMRVISDKNKNGVFEKNEVVWEKEKEFGKQTKAIPSL